MVKVKNPFVEALQNIAERQDIGSFKKIFDYFGPRLKSFLMIRRPPRSTRRLSSAASDVYKRQPAFQLYSEVPPQRDF